MKTLLLMRHAKSDWNADYGTDHERPLNDRGVRSARLMGEVLAENGHAPDMVITSTAVRARSTASLAKETGRWDAGLTLEPDLYGAGVDRAIEVAAAAPDVARVMLVGHQPTWSALVAALTGDRIDMKTAAVAVIEFDIDSWAELPGSRGTLIATYQPRDYLNS
jgi:phosphohistidine phosphatase